jgi:membrane protease YdiL (CAAX protease family)
VSDLPPAAIRVVRGTTYFFPVLTLLLWWVTPLSFLGSMYLALLLELLPGLAVAQLPLAYQEAPLPRIPVYLSSAIVILFVGALGLGVGRVELGFEFMGLGSSPWVDVVAWAAGLSAVSVALMGIFLALRRAMGIRETPLLVLLLPETPSEKAVFALLSVAAGVGEEVAYRGFLVPALILVFGNPWVAALVSSVVFGLLHTYQGWLGVVRTSVLGMVFAASFLSTGLLWPAIIAHAMLDLLAGLVLGKTLVRE